MLSKIVNRQVPLQYTNSEWEKLFFCNLLWMVNNSFILDFQRYSAFLTLSTSFPTLKWSGKSLTTYLDYTIEAINSFKSNFYYLNSVFQMIRVYSAYINTFKNGNFYPSINSNIGNFSANLFNSSYIKIDYKRYIYSGKSSLQKECYYFAFLTSQIPTDYLNFYVCGNSTSSSFTNGLDFFNRIRLRKVLREISCKIKIFAFGLT